MSVKPGVDCRVWRCLTDAAGCALLGGGTAALDTYELSAPSPDARAADIRIARY